MHERDPDPAIDVAGRLAVVRRELQAACAAAGRDPAAVTLVAVSKHQPERAIRAAYAAGQRDFGESYAREFRDKRLALQDLTDLRWHFIGHLQRNKIKWVVGHAYLHHAVDDMVGLDELTRRAWSLGVTQDVLLQVNLAGETSKRGCTEADLPVFAEVLLRSPAIRWRGLMILPPAGEAAAPWFTQLAAWRARLAKQHASALEAQGSDLGVLSMGMSGDFAAAIAAGATHVRVGTAIFGPRPSAGLRHP